LGRSGQRRVPKGRRRFALLATPAQVLAEFSGPLLSQLLKRDGNTPRQTRDIELAIPSGQTLMRVVPDPYAHSRLFWLACGFLRISSQRVYEIEVRTAAKFAPVIDHQMEFRRRRGAIVTEFC